MKDFSLNYIQKIIWQYLSKNKINPLLRSRLALFVQIKPNENLPVKSGSVNFLPIIGPYHHVKNHNHMVSITKCKQTDGPMARQTRVKP